ncbi:MAG: TrmB family transcriptional regulator [Candidatus Woesearchaeota archaeon]
MDTSILENLGLSSNEIKIYVALLEEGPSTAGSILKKANIQNSVFHFCINRLIQKGLVSYSKKNTFKIYQSAGPEQFRTFLKDKEKQLDILIPELKAKQTLSKEKQEVELFEGIKGIITLLNILIEDAKKGDEFLFFTPELEKNDEIQKFYERYDTKRKDKGLIVKGIASKKLKQLFDKRKYLKMKYTNNPVPANTGLCTDKMAIINWGEKPKGVLIRSKDIVSKQKEFFNALWKNM